MTARAPEIRHVLDARDVVGESLVWNDREGRLLWVDLAGRSIRSLDPASLEERRWRVGEFPTSIGLREDGGAIVGFTRRVALWDFGEAFKTLAVPEPEEPGNRLNEGRVAPDGSFWVGTMQSNLSDDGHPKPQTAKTGRIYRIDASGAVLGLSGDLFGITNTMAWLPDGRFVTADTTENQLFAYDVVGSGKGLANRRPFSIPYPRGLPDGSCLDRDGGLWTCRVVGGAALTRTLPDGRVDRVVDLPCSWPTSCAFGGPDLGTLFVTSARFTMADEHLARHPHEGGLFALVPGVRGVPESRFGPGAWPAGARAS